MTQQSRTFDQVALLTSRIEVLEALVLSLSEQVRGLQEFRERFKQPSISPTIPPALGTAIQLPAQILQPTQPSTLPPITELIPPDPAWIPILHRMERVDPSYPRPCGKPALYLTEPPREKRNATFDVMRVLPPGEHQWRVPTLADTPVCSSCHAFVDMFSNSDLDYLSHMLPAQSRLPGLGKKRGRRSSAEDRTVMEGASPAPASDEGLPPSFPAHVPRAREIDADTLAHLRGLADGLGRPS